MNLLLLRMGNDDMLIRALDFEVVGRTGYERLKVTER